MHSYRVRAAGRTAVAVDSEDNEACCSRWLVEVRMAAQPTCVADASRDIVVGSWYGCMTQQSGCIVKCLDFDARSRSDLLVRPANRATEKLEFETLATVMGFSTQWQVAPSYMRMSWFAKTDNGYCARSSWNLPIRFVTNWGRRRRWKHTIAVEVGWEVDRQ